MELKTRSTNLMHRINILRTTVLQSVGILFVQPNGGDWSMASLSYDASERPRINEISPEHHVLNQNVGGFLRLHSVVVRRKNGITFSGYTHRGWSKWIGIPIPRAETEWRRWWNPSPWTEARGIGNGECECESRCWNYRCHDIFTQSSTWNRATEIWGFIWSRRPINFIWAFWAL